MSIDNESFYGGTPGSTDSHNLTPKFDRIDEELRNESCSECSKTNNKGESCTQKIKVIESLGHNNGFAKKLKLYRNKLSDSLAHTLVTYHKTTDGLECLLRLSPGLLMGTRSNNLQGQTILHIAICKRDRHMVKTILKVAAEQKCVQNLLKTNATGSRFKKTVMMGQLPLSVAALVLEKPMVELLLDKDTNNIAWQNEKGDTVFHSLVRYASNRVDLIQDILKMIRFLNQSKYCEPYLTGMKNADETYVWHKINEKGMTALQLAASLGQMEIFAAILELDDVYRWVNKRSTFVIGNMFLYDITEIDTVTQAEWESYPLYKTGDNSELNPVSTSWKSPGHSPVLKHKHPAALELISELSAMQAYSFMSIRAVKELVSQKWKHYKKLFVLWLMLHLFIMVHITVYAAYKTKVINSHMFEEKSVSDELKNFVNISAGFMFLYSCIYLVAELFRTWYFGQKWSKGRGAANVRYRVILLIFSVALIIDSIWYYVQPQNNYFLIVALLLGWLFMLFFLRANRRFSFYTVIFLNSFTGDLARMSVLIFFQLLAFSVAIYSIFQHADSSEGFEDVGRASMTMFNLMLGLSDIQTLDQARQPWLAITLYILFVIITYLVLLNTLIAMMSMTCERISGDRDAQWQLQRLLVVLLLESSVCPCWRWMPKYVQDIRRFGVPNKEYRGCVEVHITNDDEDEKCSKSVVDGTGTVEEPSRGKGVGAKGENVRRTNKERKLGTLEEIEVGTMRGALGESEVGTMRETFGESEVGTMRGTLGESEVGTIRETLGESEEGTMRGTLGEHEVGTMRGALGESEVGTMRETFRESEVGTMRGTLGQSEVGTMRGTLGEHEVGTMRGALGESEVGTMRETLGESEVGTMSGALGESEEGTMRETLGESEVGPMRETLGESEVGTMRETLGESEVGTMRETLGEREVGTMRGTLGESEEGTMRGTLGESEVGTMRGTLRETEV